MGILTWVLIGVIALLIIGLGIQTIAGGLFQGAKTVGENPIVQNATKQANDAVKEQVRNGVNDALG